VHDILDPDPKLHALMPFAQYAKLQLLSPNTSSPSKVSERLSLHKLFLSKPSLEASLASTGAGVAQADGQPTTAQCSWKRQELTL
jgi:hypothetical protein